MASIEFDSSEVLANIKKLSAKMSSALDKSLFDVGTEVLRLAEKENPHDEGLLQASQVIDNEPGGYVIGYNKKYAARLHEHPEYNFQKGRKGKYLEDPIKNNINVFLTYLGEKLKKGLQ